MCFLLPHIDYYKVKPQSETIPKEHPTPYYNKRARMAVFRTSPNSSYVNWHDDTRL